MSGQSAAAAATEDPVAYFLQDMTYHGKTERTREAYERVLRDFERELNGMAGSPAVADAGERECLAWVHAQREEYAESTVATYAAYLHRFYAYMTQVGAFDANPMALVMEELDESVDRDPVRRDVAVPVMREFVAGITHPLDRAVVVTFLKTGVRVGELCNLDLRDLNLTDPEVEESYGVEPRAQVAGRPDTLFVASGVSRGETVNGAERTAANKRKRDTHVPVDQELKRCLRRWLAVRPDTPSPADPLFASTRAAWGERLTPDMVRGIVRRHAEAAGWYREGGEAGENVTPHYFRHFFTTHLRDRTGDRGVVKYLRGDVAEDIIDTYTHNWGGRVRAVYEENVYSLSAAE